MRLNANLTQTTIVASALFQIDKREAPEAGGYEGAEPRFIYDVYTDQVSISNSQLILQDDLIIDLITNDALTGKPRQWRIKNDPEPFQDWHWEFEAFRYRGV